MDYSLSHPNAIIKGEINLPSSKSLSNRALIIRALNSENFKIHNLSEANDTILLKNALNTKNGEINVEDAGTAFRFLTSYLSVTKGSFILTGSNRMKQRPIGDLVDALRKLGAKIEYLENENKPPLKITGSEIEGGKVSVKGSTSSQFISSLLMIAPTLKNGLHLTIENEIVSKPYIEMTLKMLQFFSIDYKWENNVIEIKKQKFEARDLTIESDWSAVGFWFEIISVCRKGKVKLNGLLQNSWQGDKQTPNFFNDLNISSYFENKSLVVERTEKKIGESVTTDLIDLPDLSLSLICSYAFNNKTYKFTGLQTLKNKESDRLHCLATELKKYGVICSLSQSTLIIESFNRKNDNLNFKTYNDHRIAMALAPLALKEKIIIRDVGVVKKSYPNFWNDLRSVGFIINEEVRSNS